MITELRIEDVSVKERFRKDFGDIELLANSINSIGLLHPVVVNSNNELICGGRRLKAFQFLGKVTIPARVIDIDSIILGEYAENEVRKDFTVSERVAIGEAVEVELGERRGGDQKSKCKILHNDPNEGSKTIEIAAQKSGFRNKETYRQAKKVVETATSELVEAMDSGRVKPSVAEKLSNLPQADQILLASKGKEKEAQQAAKEIRIQNSIKKRDEIAQIKKNNPIVIPEGKYSCIVIDPPWEMKKIDRDVRPNQVEFDYPTMNENELSELSVQNLSSDDCHLFCWTTHKHLPVALRLLERWGFRYVCTFVWHKPGGFQPIGLPQYNCEFVLYARKGSPEFIDTKAFNCCFEAPRREHSRKPDEFYELIKRVTDEPRIDFFSRELREGFDQFGNETRKFA